MIGIAELLFISLTSRPHSSLGPRLNTDIRLGLARAPCRSVDENGQGNLDPMLGQHHHRGRVQCDFGRSKSFNKSSVILQARQQTKMNRVFKIYHAWLALPPTAIGCVFTIIFCLAVIRAIQQHRVSRKCYILILNRAFGDIFACVTSFIVIGYTLSVHDVR